MSCPKLLCFIGELSNTEHVMVIRNGPPDLLDTCHAPGECRSTQSQVKQEPTVHYYSYPSLLTSNSRYQIIYSTSSTMSGFLFSWSSSFIKSVVQLNTKHKFKQTVCLLFCLQVSSGVGDRKRKEGDDNGKMRD